MKFISALVSSFQSNLTRRQKPQRFVNKSVWKKHMSMLESNHQPTQTELKRFKQGNKNPFMLLYKGTWPSKQDPHAMSGKLGHTQFLLEINEPSHAEKHWKQQRYLKTIIVEILFNIRVIHLRQVSSKKLLFSLKDEIWFSIAFQILATNQSSQFKICSRENKFKS